MIHRSPAHNASPGAPPIAETGGLNAMIVDSTAPPRTGRAGHPRLVLPERRRRSALRMLYVQKDVAEKFLATMLHGAMEALEVGDPAKLASDIGPVIDEEAKEVIERHVARFEKKGALLKRLSVPAAGHFCAPTVLPSRNSRGGNLRPRPACGDIRGR
ncbi:MAG: aldehyde dehydrogenase family protein [Geminicoccaceae bacterium]